MKPLAQQLRERWIDLDITLPVVLRELRRLTGTNMWRSSLSRKLRGEQVMFTSEAEALAQILGVEIRTGTAKRPALKSRTRRTRAIERYPSSNGAAR